jgi:predicted 3-demethylubiquinone-9 3-methyltransferase (glyoxalase superfamily)
MNLASFKFSEGISLYVNCDTQEEIDDYWEKLSRGSKKQPCGWVTEKYGVSWQIAPTVVHEMMKDPDPEKVERVNKAIYKMTKLNIEKIKRAYKGD